MAAPTCIITTVKEFTYRDKVGEEWSNRYMLSGPTPNGPTVWHDLFEELAAVERAILTPRCSITRAFGHISTDPHATQVWEEVLDVPLPGLFVRDTGLLTPGDAATFISFRTGRKNVKGKTVYLRKYFHDAVRDANDPDGVYGPQRGKLLDLGNVLVNGITTDSRILVDPLGNPALGCTASEFVTTRTLKRRGRRPH